MAKKQDVFFPNEPFETTVRRWALEAAVQYRDTYKYQKLYVEGGSPDDYEVWRRPGKRRIYTYDKPYHKGVKRRKVSRREVSSWGWYDENQRRQQLAKRNPGVDYWYSTGESYKHLDVQAINIKEDPEEMIVSGEVRFVTTMHLLFAEAGVGRKGKRNNIKVQRDAPFAKQRRYARWIPGKGDTHRPSTKQQVYYMRRRLIWLAKNAFNYQLSTWLQLQFREVLDMPSQHQLAGGISFEITPGQ